MINYRSWGYCPSSKQQAIRPAWNDFEIDLLSGTVLPYGNGRSYGDSCLNSSGKVIDCRSLNRFISLDFECGVLRCESGLMFSEILDTIVPNGWFLPVTPGTKYITMGGAIANDVHGKNHHQDGTIGNHVKSFELLRSDGQRIVCSKNKNSDLFKATIGGLGLTGFVTWVEIQLIRIKSSYMEVNTIPFKDLDEFCEFSTIAQEKYRYTVAWLDCTSTGGNFARGLFMQANHLNKSEEPLKTRKKKDLSVPVNCPKYMLNKFSVKAFNAFYYHNQKRTASHNQLQHYDSYFYPLDGIRNWNRIYGKQGFFQYQFVVPKSATEVMKKILVKIVNSGLGSFLTVLKEFGDIDSPGMLSFPRPGICLALDFSNRGRVTQQLLNELDELVMSVDGAVYPAKDNRMSSAAFKAYYPNYQDFVEFIDPNFTSDFWKRVYSAK